MAELELADDDGDIEPFGIAVDDERNPTEEVEVTTYRFGSSAGSFYSVGREIFERPKLPRYQIHLMLVDDAGVPRDGARTDP